MSIYSVGIGALNAAQVGILTTSHNISNSSTTGYNRQILVQGTNVPLLTGSGFIGNGVHVSTVRRIYDDHLARQVLHAGAGASEMDTYLTQIQQIDNLLADPDAGMTPALAAFFKGVQEVAANPASIPGRQSMLSSARALVARFQGLDQRMSEIRQGLNAQVSAQAQAVNSYAGQIAELNQQIIFAEAGSLTQAPNDLYDQRDQLLRDLNKIVGVNMVQQSDGSFNLFIGKGQPLVVGTQAYTLSAVAAADDPERYVIAMTGVGGTTMTLPESQITGGALGGLLGFRSGTLDDAQNALGAIAVTLGQNFNDQHRLGMDLTGLLGGNFFNIAQPQLRANSLNAGAGAPTVAFDTTNIDQLSGSDYRLTYLGVGNYQLTRISDGNVQSFAALPQTVDGITIGAGTWVVPAVNDSFLIQPTRYGARNLTVAVSDPRAIAAAAPIRTSAALANTGTGSVSAGTVNAPPPPNANLQHQVTITFDNPAGTFDVFDVTAGASLATNVAFTAGANITYNGWTVQISGTPAAGDVFVIEQNASGVADNRNAQLLGALQTQSTMLGGATYNPTATYQSAYSQIVSAVGAKAAEVKIVGLSQQGLVDHATTAMQQASGVNLDEEAANLLRYQQAYQAAAKILEIANRVFDEVLALGR